MLVNIRRPVAAVRDNKTNLNPATRPTKEAKQAAQFDMYRRLSGSLIVGDNYSSFSLLHVVHGILMLVSSCWSGSLLVILARAVQKVAQGMDFPGEGTPTQLAE